MYPINWRGNPNTAKLKTSVRCSLVLSQPSKPGPRAAFLYCFAIMHWLWSISTWFQLVHLWVLSVKLLVLLLSNIIWCAWCCSVAKDILKGSWRHYIIMLCHTVLFITCYIVLQCYPSSATTLHFEYYEEPEENSSKKVSSAFSNCLNFICVFFHSF